MDFQAFAFRHLHVGQDKKLKNQEDEDSFYRSFAYIAEKFGPEKRIRPVTFRPFAVLILKTMATAHREVCADSQNLHIFVSKDILNATRERAGLFSHVKSGKFSSGGNKLTSHTIDKMAWAVAYLARRFTRAYMTK